MVLRKIKDRHQVFTDIEFFFIWVSLSHRVQFLQQLHMCARNDWPGQDKFLLIMTPFFCFLFFFSDPATEKNDLHKKKKKKIQLWGFTICLLHTNCTCILLHTSSTCGKKSHQTVIPSSDGMLNASTDSVHETYATYARAQHTCIQTGTHTHTSFFFFV